MSRRILASLLLALGILLGPPAAGGDAEPPSRAIRELEKAVKDLASHGRRPAVETVLDVLTRLGVDPGDVEDCRESAERKLRRSEDEPEAAPRAAKYLRRAAEELEDWLAERPQAERARIAAIALSLDGSSTACHELLGHVERDGRWMTAQAAACADRKAAIADAVVQARSLEVPIVRSPSDDPLLPALYGEKGHSVSVGNFSLHSVRVPPAKLERILREAMRAGALAHWLYGKGLVPPRLTGRPRAIVLLDSREDYPRAIAEELEAGRITERGAADARRMAGFFAEGGRMIYKIETEAGTTANTFVELHWWLTIEWYGSRLQPCLDVGIANWVCLTCLGTPIPLLAWFEEDGPGPESRSATERELREHRRMLRLARAGIAGSRAYLRWLVSRRADPAYRESMRAEPGQIQGKELLKATFVAEYLLETGEFAGICGPTAKSNVPAAAMPEALAKALGYDLAELERRWRAWLMPVGTGLADRVDRAGDEGLSADERRLLEYLEEIRKEARVHSTTAITLDPDASRGCRLHAAYLKRHPKQLAAWPDAHEEYPDREGFTPEGARAGLASVIAPGVSGPEEAIDGWMGTYFHRLPLLDPGLIRVGWALENGVAILDSGSFVAPAETVCEIRWPPDGARDVPVAFRPELPNPFPGEDQSAWGYPVTLQLFHADGTPPVGMKLYRGGGPAGEEVPARFSSPTVPGNPELAPADSYALIPKRHLDPGTKYTVVATGLPEGRQLRWSFTTGR